MKVKVTKQFQLGNNGRVYQPGDEFEGTPEDCNNLVREGYADPPKPEKEPPPPEPLPTTITLTKGFQSGTGKVYKAGDEYTGTPEDISNLIREGYADDPRKPKEAVTAK